jgi:four helix bundle protein
MKLRVIDDVVDMVGRVHALAKIVGRQDLDLARQMRRSASSVGLNAGEGAYGRDGNRTTRLESAMCSGRETMIALRIAGAAQYLDRQIVAREVDTIDRIVATLYKLAYRRRG